MILLSDLKDHLKISGSAEDSYLYDLEAAAVEYVETRTRRYFGAESETTEHLEGLGHRRLHLAEEPATIPATVTERTYPAGDGTTVTASEDNGYVLRGRQLIRKAGLVWQEDYEYEATYDRGYTENSEDDGTNPADIEAPADIRRAVTLLVAHWYELRLPVQTGTIVTEIPMGVPEIMGHWARRLP